MRKKMRYLIIATHPSKISWGEVKIIKKDLIQTPTLGRRVGGAQPRVVACDVVLPWAVGATGPLSKYKGKWPQLRGASEGVTIKQKY